jgi:quercetin dioxygenase-like cupin family protein
VTIQLNKRRPYKKVYVYSTTNTNSFLNAFSSFEEVKRMNIFPYTDVEAKDAEGGSTKLKVRWLITKEIGAANFAMRLFEMEAGGNSPLHSHSWEHEVFILEGEGLVVGGQEEKKFKAGDAIFIPSNEKHQLKNNSKKTCKFLCLIPYKKE